MRVNQLAKETGVDAHTIRYYSRLGLLQPERDPRNRYREYAMTDIGRLRFIRRAKTLGFTLDEIGRILREADHGEGPSPEVRTILQARVQTGRASLAELQELQRRMESTLAGWRNGRSGSRNRDGLVRLIREFAEAGESGSSGEAGKRS